MDPHAIAAELLDRAVHDQQAVMRCDLSTPIEAIRAEVRRLARDRSIAIRTGMIGEVLAVVKADASLWSQPVSTMRAKLAAPSTPNVVR
ncbi:MAG: hypothetical protein AAGC66_07770 [Leifsonia sp.]